MAPPKKERKTIPARLLIVDDNSSVTTTLRAALENDGYLVWTANTMDDVRALLDRQKSGVLQFDVAIVDLRLGETDGDGIEVMKMLRTRQPDCVSIVLTGYGSLESAVDAMRQGAYDYLTKPCRMDELQRAVKGALERGATSRSLREHMERVLRPATIAASSEVELTPHQFQALALLWHGSRRVSDIAEALGIRLTAATGLIDRLEAKHLVRRIHDPVDRRVIHIQLTPQGMKEADSLWLIRREWLDQLTGVLTPDERDLVVRAFNVLASAMDRRHLGDATNGASVPTANQPPAPANLRQPHGRRES